MGARHSAITHQVPDLGPSPCSSPASLAQARPGEGGQPRVHVGPRPAGATAALQPAPPSRTLDPQHSFAFSTGHSGGVSKPQGPKATPCPQTWHQEGPQDGVSAGVDPSPLRT